MQKIINVIINSEFVKKVWIGDPSYVIAEDLWDSVREQTKDGQEDGHTIEFTTRQCQAAGFENVESKPLLFLQCRTMSGDGVYDSKTGYMYGVDSGGLAVVPDYLISKENKKDAGEFGQYFEVSGIVRLESSGTGIFTFFDGDKIIEEIFTDDACEE